MVNFQESSEDSSNSSEANIIVCPNTTFFLRDFLEGENRTKIETIPQVCYELDTYVFLR